MLPFDRGDVWKCLTMLLVLYFATRYFDLILRAAATAHLNGL